MKNIAIILAGGQSTRFGGEKLLTEKFGTPVLTQTLEKFDQCKDINEIILVGKTPKVLPKKVTHVLAGGKERFFSLQNALRCLEKKETKNCRIIVHNGANPFVTTEEINAGIKYSAKKKNVIFGFFTPNSVKEIKNGKVNKFLVRKNIFESQTPQISDLETFLKALKKQEKKKKIPHDEAELLAMAGEEIFIFECSPKNQKITTEHDFPDQYVLGLGEDSHAFLSSFDPKFPVKLGGIAFPESRKSFQANSDGDVVLHALCNALMSSVGEKTLSSFADKMSERGEKNSEVFLKKALSIARKKHPRYEIQNVVISLECAAPTIAPRHEEIQKNISRLLSLPVFRVGLTYTSGEKLSAFGKGEGVRCIVEILAKI